MNRAYKEAFAEVDEILKIMPIELLTKIPTKFRNIISENKDAKINSFVLNKRSIVLLEFTDNGSIVEVFSDITLWFEIKKIIDRINANAIAA